MKNTSIKNKIKEYYFINNSDKLRVREIERKLNIPLPSAIRYSKELVDENILAIQDIGNVRLFIADKSSKEYLIQKKLFNLYSLHESGLIEYIIKELHNPLIILFGSYSRGEDVDSSDIDIFIQTSSDKSLDLKKYEIKLRRKIELFIKKNLIDIPNKNLRNNIINGITLNGYIEVFK